MAAADETASVSVSFKIPREKTSALLYLKEEVGFRKDQEPPFVEVVCGIVGPPNSGRKLLGDRFRRMEEKDIEEISKDNQLCYSANFDLPIQGRRIRGVIKAYIIPPPPSDAPPEVPPKDDSAEVPMKEDPFIEKALERNKNLYMHASHQFCCLLFAFDVTNMDGFREVCNCVKKLKMTLPDKYFLVGNKCDLRGTDPNRKEVPPEVAKAVARRIGAFGYFECSAKRNIRVKSIIEAVVSCEKERPHV